MLLNAERGVGSFSMQSLTLLANDQLVAALNALDVQFLFGGKQPLVDNQMNPPKLLCSLAMSDDARFRLAIIPLLLRHPEFAIATKVAVEESLQEAQIVLKCYYTAAHLLQQKYFARLQRIFGTHVALPDLFGAELGLITFQNVDEGLSRLAQHQRTLSGRSINWLGTYEHGAQRLLLHHERRQAWQRSQ